MVLHRKSSQEYPSNTKVSRGCIFSDYALMTFFIFLSVILLPLLMILLSTHSLIKHLILCQQLEFDSNREFDVWDTVDWSRKFLVDFNVGKTVLVSFVRDDIITGMLLMWKLMRLFLKKNYLLRCWGYLFSFELDWSSLSLLLKLSSRKLEQWFIHLNWIDVFFSWGCSLSL